MSTRPTNGPEQIAAALAQRYRIEREIGRGGMAVVHLAHDVKHDRKVAIKVMHSELAELVGPARFLAEIRTTASLQHPSIVPLFDSGDVDGQPYFVMPFVTGESLRLRLTRQGPMPVESAVRITCAIADALEYAHAHGVVHRDIKPENILMDGDRVFITDFGIALAVGRTDGTRLTQTGMSFGTPAYMSPEQAAGDRTVGVASDVYSLACVCYELLTGEPPFTGNSVQAIHAKKFSTSPPRVGTLRDVPEAVDAVIFAAMAREASDRPSSAAALAASLSGALAGDRRPALRLARRRTVRWIVAGALVLTTVGGVAAWGATRLGKVPVLGTVQPLSFEQGLELEPNMSPEGRYIAYAAGTPSRIYLRQSGSRPVALVTPDTGPPQRRPRWSPDGSQIAFDAGRRVYVIPALGGTPRQVASDGWSPAWAPDGRRIAFALGDTIFTTRLDAGNRTRLAVVPQPAELTWSRDGRWIALSSGNDAWDGITQIGNIAQSRIVLVSADDGRVVPVTEPGSMNVSPQWSPDSRQILFISNRDGSRDLYALRLNASGRAMGMPSRLSTGLDAHTFGISPAGDRVTYAAYHARVNIWSLPIRFAAPAGLAAAASHTTGTQAIEGISASRDGRWLYFTSDRSGNSDIWRVPVAGGEPEQVTNHPADDFAPESSPDGEWLAFYSLRNGTRDIWLMPTRPGEAIRLTDSPGDEYAPHWSPDGESLCYGQRSVERGNSARLLRRRGGAWGEPVILSGGKGAENNVPGCAGWHLDGRHLVVQEHGQIALLPVDGGVPRVIYTPDPSAGRPVPLYVRVDRRTGRVFFRAEASIWALDAGGSPRELLRFDDPGRQSTRLEMDMYGDRIFFSLGDPQADLFIAELSWP